MATTAQTTCLAPLVAVVATSAAQETPSLLDIEPASSLLPSQQADVLFSNALTQQTSWRVSTPSHPLFPVRFRTIDALKHHLQLPPYAETRCSDLNVDLTTDLLKTLHRMENIFFIILHFKC